jgi:hypothetical protein
MVGAAARMALAAAILAGAWPGAAWARTQVLSRSAGTGVRVAANPRGDAAVAWESGLADRRRVLVAVRRAGGRFGRPRVLGAGGAPRLGIDGAGNVLVAWQGRSGVRARWRSAHGRLSRLQEVDPRGGANPDVAVSAGGVGVVVWEHQALDARERLTADRVWATWGRANRRLGPPQPVSGPAAPTVVVPPHGPITETLLLPMDPRVALGEDGTVVAAWMRTDGTSAICCQAVETATTVPGGPFGAVVRVSAALAYESVDGPAVSVGPDGGTLVAWDQIERGEILEAMTIVAAWRDPGTSSFSTPQTISGAPPPTWSWPERHPMVVAGRAGYGLVVWPADGTQSVSAFAFGTVIAYAERRAGPFAAQAILGGPIDRIDRSPQAVMGLGGQTIVVWQRSRGIAISTPPGRRARTVARVGAQPSVAVVPGGALVAWSGDRVGVSEVFGG